ncbi:MAG: hypothetical protein HQL06_15470 [Nitrospirae bacterium]|nr:hypothetical protein [Nitrospirota bacterium]
MDFHFRGNDRNGFISSSMSFLRKPETRCAKGIGLVQFFALLNSKGLVYDHHYFCRTTKNTTGSFVAPGLDSFKSAAASADFAHNGD